jgi:hypothetical protein
MENAMKKANARRNYKVGKTPHLSGQSGKFSKGAILMLHKNSRERYTKLRKVFRRLMRNFNLDDLDEFIATANSMPEWMKNDPSLTQERRDALARFTVPESLDWQICNQIANRQKHVKPQRQGGAPLQVNSVQIHSGGRGIWLRTSPLVIGAGEEVFIDYGGRKESALAFVIRTFKHFHYMFEMAPVPPAQRHIPTLSDLAGV